MLRMIVKNFILLNICLAAGVFFLGLNVLLMISNYLACKLSFELLGTEMRPLFSDELIGSFFAVFGGEATLAHFYALLVAVIVTIGFFMVVKILFDVWNLMEDRLIYESRRDIESLKIVNRRIIGELITLGVLAYPLVCAVYWDIHLFRFRSILQANGIEHAEGALNLMNWELQIKENISFWMWDITRIGAQGYLAITMLACIFLEISIQKTRWYGERFLNALETILNPQEPGRPAVIQAETEERLRTRSHANAGYPDSENIGISQRSQNRAADEPSIQTMAIERQGGNNKGSSGLVGQKPTSGGNNGSPIREHEEETLFDPPPATVEDQGNLPSAMTFAAGSEDARYEVVGRKGERVTLASALSNPDRYWVNPDLKEVWDANYRKSLFNDQNS